MPRNKTASVRSTRQFQDTDDEPTHQGKPRDLKSTGPARAALDPPLVESVDKPINKAKLDALAFDAEILTVMVHESTNPQDHPAPEVWNDGRLFTFFRGEEQQVARKFVEVLARSKRTVYSQQKIKDANGIESYRNVPHTALMYPFTVIADPNVNGRAWLKKILAEA